MLLLEEDIDFGMTHPKNMSVIQQVNHTKYAKYEEFLRNS